MRQLKILLVLTAILPYRIAAAQVSEANDFKKKQHNTSTYDPIQVKTKEIIEPLIAIRRDFHMYPELSGQEKRTSAKIAKYLSDLGLEVHTNIGGYGVLGILNGANNNGRRIAWRADIDAIPITESNSLSFKSKVDGAAHLCGHDVHTSIALGIATVLADQKENLTGTVYFIFQPSEENLKGAQAMIDDGLLDLVKPGEIYALHVTPFPAGTIAVKSEEMFASLKKLEIAIKTTGDNQKLIEYTKNQIKNLQNIDPGSKFWNPMNMGDPEIGIAGPKSIYKNYTILNGDIDVIEQGDRILITAFLSLSDRDQQNSVIPYLERQFANPSYAQEFISAELLAVTPTLLNDETLTKQVTEGLLTKYGPERIIPLTGIVSDGRSDDFALFQEKIPGVYFFLGGSNYEHGIISEPHSPGFAVDETCLETGVQVFSTMIMDRLKRID